MVTGAETPLLSGIKAGAQPGQGRAFVTFSSIIV
jgi:hypothetical protein